MKLTPIACLLFMAALPLFADESLPSPWKHQDIGAVKTAGTAAHADGVFTLSGTMDIWGVADGCQFVSQPIHGDAELVARVAAVDNPGGVAHAKASLCVRESLDAGSRQVTMCVTATDGTQFVYRDKTDGKTVRYMPKPEDPKSTIGKGQFPCWLKLVRHGNVFTGYESADGEKWQVIGEVTIAMPADALIGLAASSHKPDVLTKATFDHVKVAGRAVDAPAKP
jgi:hypothetical protein